MDKTFRAIELEKTQLRKVVTHRLKAQSPDIRREKSNLILRKLSELKTFQNAKTIMFYVALDEEVETVPLLKQTIQNGKTVTVPYVNRLSNSLLSVWIKDVEEDLEPGTYGILEPKKTLVPTHVHTQVDVVIVPGIAFDPAGHRLGRGKGYYDRFLKTLPPHIFTVGLAYDIQMFESIPVSEMDIRVKQVITN